MHLILLGVNVFACFLATASEQQLIVSELMFRPDGPSALQHQWLELKSVGDEPFDFAGVALVKGIRISLHDMHPLPPGSFLVIAKNPELFQRKYGFAPSNDAAFAGTLSASYDVIEVYRARNRILRFRYGGRAPWPATARGFGFSLTLRSADSASLDLLSYPSAWRASAYRGGSPGFDDPAPPWASVPALQLTQLLAHTDLPLVDAVELYNPTDQRVNLTGFSITSDPSALGWRAFTFPFVGNDTVVVVGNATVTVPGEALTHIEPQQRLIISELKLGFRLSSQGDRVYLFYAVAPAFRLPSGFADGVEFGATANGVGLMRVVNSVGVPVWVPAVWPKLERRLPRAVISSILYRPASSLNGGEDTRLEYIEVVNVASDEIKFWSEGFRSGSNYYNTWRIECRDDVLAPSFEFPRDIRLQPNESLLIVGVEPAVFRAAAGVASSVQVLGPWKNGPLPNTLLRVALLFPDEANIDLTVPYVIEDELEYSATAPWPRLTVDTAGKPLVRINRTEIGDEPRNWRWGDDATAAAASSVSLRSNDEIERLSLAVLLLLPAVGWIECA